MFSFNFRGRGIGDGTKIMILHRYRHPTVQMNAYMVTSWSATARVANKVSALATAKVIGEEEEEIVEGNAASDLSECYRSRSIWRALTAFSYCSR